MTTPPPSNFPFAPQPPDDPQEAAPGTASTSPEPASQAAAPASPPLAFPFQPGAPPKLILGTPAQNPADYQPETVEEPVAPASPPAPDPATPVTKQGKVSTTVIPPWELEAQQRQADESDEQEESDETAALRAAYYGVPETTESASEGETAAPAMAELSAPTEAYGGGDKSQAVYTRRDAKIDAELESLKKKEWSKGMRALLLVGLLILVAIGYQVVSMMMAKNSFESGVQRPEVEASEAEYKANIGKRCFRYEDGEVLGTIKRVAWREEGDKLGTFARPDGSNETLFAPKAAYYYYIDSSDGETVYACMDVGSE